jgi:hypothetical protein
MRSVTYVCRRQTSVTVEGCVAGAEPAALETVVERPVVETQLHEVRVYLL